MAQVSYGTITITDTNDIESIVVEYARNQSTSIAPTSGWSTNRPAWAQDYYIWQRTRIHKAGTLDTEDEFGTAVCITGAAGQTGAAGRGLTATETTYTSVANGTTQSQVEALAESAWTTSVPSYNASKPDYWVRVKNTYDKAPTTVYIYYKDNATGESLYNAAVANSIAQNANENAQGAMSQATAAQQLAIKVDTLLGGHFIHGAALSQATPASARVIEQIQEGNIDVSDVPSKWHHNVLIGANGISLRYNEAVMAQLAANQSSSANTALKFYKPPTVSGDITTQGALAMELSNNGLAFYDGSSVTGGNIQAQFGASGAIQSGDYVINSITDKFSTYGTKIDLVHGEIYSPYFRLSQGSVSDGPVAGIYMSGTFESTGAIIGYQKISNSDSNAYWKMGYMTDINQDKLTYQRADNNGFIELAPNATFILQKNKIHTGWFGSNGYLTYPQLNSKYYDFGINLPTSLSDKFLYIRYNSSSDLSTIYQNDSGWTYPFYVDAEGKVHAQNFYIGNSDTPIGGGAGTVAERLTQGYGSASQPIYFNNNGVPTNTTYTLNAAGAKGVDTSMPTTATDSNVPTTKLMKTFVEGKGYITGYTETDPTVPSWAKAENKPSYSLNEITGTEDLRKIETLTGTSGFLKKTAANTWSLDTNTYLTSYTETDPIFTSSAAYGITSSDITNWNGKTSNVGTVTQVSAGVGLAGGDITSTGILKAKLRSETKLTNDSAAATETSGRVYPVVLDKSGYLAVNVPWTNVNSSYLTSNSTLNWNKVTTNRPTTLSGYGITDANIANGVVTLGSDTISKMPNPNALTIKIYNASTATAQGSTYSPTEVSYDGSVSGKTASVAGTNAITNISASAASGGSSTFTVVKADGSSSTFNVNISGAVVSGATILTNSSGVGLDVDGPVYFDDGTPKSMKPTTSTGLFLKDDGTWATPSAAGSATNATYATYDASEASNSTKVTIANKYIPKSIGTAAGDIIYWSASGTPARLAKGSNGQVLKLANGVPAWGTDNNDNTWRAIQVNGTDILGTGTSTGKLNLKAGSNVTITNDSGTVTIASSYTNTDTKVTQTYSTTNNSYPLLMTATAGVSSTSSRGDTTAILNNAIYANPSTGILNITGLSAKKINNYLTGSGTAASDKGSGVSPRYFPAKWTFNAGITPTNGDIIIIKLPVAGHSYGVFLSTNNGTNYYPVVVGNGTSRLTTHYGNGTPIQLIFDSNGSAADMYALNGADARATVTGGVWRVLNYYGDGNTIPQAYCSTAAATAAKAASMSGYVATANRYVMVTMTQANSSAGAITLNINSTGAKPIYINGSASSSSNYTLPAGSYLVFYNGTNYYFRTDNIITGNITGNAATATKLASAQTVYVTLGTASTTTTIQGGSSSAQTIGVNGTLAIGNGGTGATTAANARSNLGLGSAATASTTTSIASGGTGLPTAGTVYTYVSNQVGNYVAKSGDTMTGTLTTPELITTKLTAKDVNVTHLLTAEGIQTKNWTTVNMATIDGSFYIVPTVTAATASVKYTTNGTLEFTATGTSTFATNSLFINGDATNWTVNSLIMITGLVHIGSEDISIGTLKGTLKAVNPTNKTLTLGGTITSSIGTNTPDILSLLTAGTTYTCKDIKVSIYSYYNNSHENLLGIMMTTAGTKNRTYIDIYDGTHQTNAATDYYDSNTTYTEPVVRIGNLRGLPVMANGDAPTGWGIYTTNGFFRGIISAESGHIGKTSANKIVISDNASNAAIYSGSHSTLASTNTGFYIGVDGISIGSNFKYIGGTTNTLTVDSIIATNFSFNSGSISGSVTIGTGGSSITNSLAAKAAVNAEYSVDIVTSNFNPAATSGTLVTLTAKVTRVNGGSISGIKYQWFGDNTSLGAASTTATSYNVPYNTTYNTFTVEIS